jgi:hypothetical protein
MFMNRPSDGRDYASGAYRIEVAIPAGATGFLTSIWIAGEPLLTVRILTESPAVTGRTDSTRRDPEQAASNCGLRVNNRPLPTPPAEEQWPEDFSGEGG